MRTNLGGGRLDNHFTEVGFTMRIIEGAGENAGPLNIAIFHFNYDRSWPSTLSYFHETCALKIKIGLVLRHTSPPAPEIAGTGLSDTAGGWEGAIQSYNHSAQGVKSYPLPTKTNGFARVIVRVIVAFLKEKELLCFKKQQSL